MSFTESVSKAYEAVPEMYAKIMSRPALRNVLYVVLCVFSLSIMVHATYYMDRLLDLNVYRLGAAALLTDPSTLYSVRFASYPFTYPVFAAWIFAPMVLFTPQACSVFMDIFDCAVLIAVIRHAHLWLARRQGRSTSWWITFFIFMAFLGSWPIWDNLREGQINFLLLALCYGPLVSKKNTVLSGILIGLAAGIKITPLGLILVLLLQRRNKTIVGTLAGFGGSVGLMWALYPQASHEFWFEKLWQFNRVGDTYASVNVSLNAPITAYLGQGKLSQILWAAGVLVVVASCSYIINVLYKNGVANSPIAAGFGSLTILLISPISWNHHWVWLPIILLAFVWSAEDFLSAKAPLWISRSIVVLSVVTFAAFWSLYSRIVTFSLFVELLILTYGLAKYGVKTADDQVINTPLADAQTVALEPAVV